MATSQSRVFLKQKRAVIEKRSVIRRPEANASSPCFLYGEVSSTMLFVWDNWSRACFLYGRRVFRHVFTMGEVFSTMLFVWENCPLPCFLYGKIGKTSPNIYPPLRHWFPRSCRDAGMHTVSTQCPDTSPLAHLCTLGRFAAASPHCGRVKAWGPLPGVRRTSCAGRYMGAPIQKGFCMGTSM